MSNSISELQVKSVDEARKAMNTIGVDKIGIRLMENKFLLKVIKIRDVRTAVANIIKQEMLSIGADAAVNKDTVNCRAEKTDVILMATLKQYKRFISKMLVQIPEAKQIGLDLKTFLKEVYE